MPDGILALDDLRAISGLQQQGAIERWLRREGIAFKRGPKGPWTTREAVNASLGALRKQAQAEDGMGAEVA